MLARRVRGGTCVLLVDVSDAGAGLERQYRRLDATGLADPRRGLVDTEGPRTQRPSVR